MSQERVEEARKAVMRAADTYSIAEGSGGDTSDAISDLKAELDEFEKVVREDENEGHP